MSYQAHGFVACLKTETPAEKTILYTLAWRHHHLTGLCRMSEHEIAEYSGLSMRHVRRVLTALEHRGVIRRPVVGNGRGLVSSFEFCNFERRTSCPETRTSASRKEDIESRHNKEIEKQGKQEKQIPPTPLFQRGGTAATRRRLTSRDIRNLVKEIDQLYQASVGTDLSFDRAFEGACSRCLIHPEDARQAIGIDRVGNWRAKIPPQAVNE